MQPSLLPIALIALAAWAAALGAVMVATHARISGHAATSGKRADIPPAIVALLCARNGKVPDSAVTATFLDLIGRGVLKRVTERSGQARIEIPAVDRSALRPYERQLLDHIAARANLGNGAALQDALRLESSEHTKRWMADFSGEVIAEARERGLVQARVSAWTAFSLLFGLLVAVVLLAIAAIGTLTGVLAYFTLAQLVLMLDGERPTKAGSNLMPTYRALAADGPAGDRNAAYIAAIGSGEPSPLAHRDESEVWTNRSGQWCKVRIVDSPVLFHGTDPVAALYSIPGALAFFGAWTALLYLFTAHPERWSIPPIVLVAGWVIYLLGNFFVWRFVYRGIYDLRTDTIGIEGQVIYLDVRDDNGEHPGTTYHVAIDDGRSSKAVRHEIDRKLFEQLRYGDRLRLDVTPKLGCVRSTRIVTAPT